MRYHRGMTILREAEHRALAQISLSGKVLDLGGDTRSSYRKLFQGSFTLAIVNIDPQTHPDVVADLEKPLPISDASYDGVLLINVLEHIFEYRTLLAECRRVLRPGGKLVIVVPYLFPYHPSPDDYYRYSASTLKKLLTDFSHVSVTPLGTGVTSARWVLFERLLPGKLQRAVGVVVHPLVRGLDISFTALARALKKRYDPSEYALGFVVTAEKPA